MKITKSLWWERQQDVLPKLAFLSGFLWPICLGLIICTWNTSSNWFSNNYRFPLFVPMFIVVPFVFSVLIPHLIYHLAIKHKKKEAF